jgi:NTE family protein
MFLGTEFLQPVEERGSYFVAPYARVGQEIVPVFSGGSRVGEYQTKETRAGVDGGVFVGTWGEARIGPVWRQINAMTVTGSQVLPEAHETSAGLRAVLFVDQLDNAWFPRSGYRLTTTAYAADDSLGSDRNYRKVAAEGMAAGSWRVHTVNLKLAGGADPQSNMPAYEHFRLGGPLRLSGYRIDEFSGERYAFGRLMYYNRAIPLPDVLGSGVFAGASLEAGKMQARSAGQASPGTLLSGSVFLAASTFAGPAYFGFGVGENGHYSLYLLIGAP